MEIVFTYKEIPEIPVFLFLKIRLENDSSLQISSDYSSKMNMLNIYPQDVDYGPLPLALNNLGSVKQGHHKLPLLLFHQHPVFKKTQKKIVFSKDLIVFLHQKCFLHKIWFLRNLRIWFSNISLRGI